MKLIKEDDKLFHFQTPDGDFKVVKKGLSKGALDKINKIKQASVPKMADGGDVHALDPDKTKDFVKGYAPTASDQAMNQAVQHPIDTISKALHFANGGAVQRFVDGGQAQAQFDAPIGAGEGEDDINPGQPAVVPDRAPASEDGGWFKNDLPTNLPDFGKAVGAYIKPGIERVKDVGRGIGAIAGGIGDVGSGVLQGAGITDPAAPASAAPSTSAPSAEDNAKALQEAMQPKGSPGAQQKAPGDLSGGIDGLINKYGSQQQALAKIQAAGAQAQADKLDQYMNTMTQYQSAAQQAHAKIEQDNQNLTNDIRDSKIDPNRLINNMGIGNKIGTAIGILFGGIGGGAHGTNMALGVLQNQINQDIDSQKTDLGKKQTLLSDNLKRLGNMYEAENATRLQMGAMLQGQIQKQALLTGSQAAMQTANLAQTQLQLQMQPLKMQMAQMQAARSIMQDPNAAPEMKIMMNPLLDKSMKAASLKALGESRNIHATSDKGGSLYSQADADTTNPAYWFHDSPAQAALKTNIKANLHKTVGIRSPEALKEMAGAYTPTLMGHLFGQNAARQNNLQQMTGGSPQSPLLNLSGVKGSQAADFSAPMSGGEGAGDE